MRYYLLLVLVSWAAFAAASLTAVVPVAALWPRMRRRMADTAPGARARGIAVFRLLPAGAGFAVAAAVAAAFVRFEPRETAETPGALLIAAMAVTLGLGLLSAWRVTRAAAAGVECTRLLRACGRVMIRDDGTRVWLVPTDYPVAAVTGLFRTRVLLSTRIASECSRAELDAVVRHEQAHVTRRDNLVRAAMLYLPDPLALTRAGREMHAAWSAAAEEAADDLAAGAAIEARTVLAAALVRVARMADRPAPAWMPATTFFEGTNLEHRVRRLLDARRRPGRLSLPALTFGAIAAAAWMLALTAPAARVLHGWMEAAVRAVP